MMKNFELIKQMTLDEMVTKNAAKILVLSKSSEFIDEVYSSSHILVREWLESEVMMKLKDLKHKIDFIYEQYKNSPEIPDNLDVVITTSEHSIGGRDKVNVKYADRGIDWEGGQFRIEPACKLIKVKEVENE